MTSTSSAASPRTPTASSFPRQPARSSSNSRPTWMTLRSPSSKTALSPGSSIPWSNTKRSRPTAPTASRSAPRPTSPWSSSPPLAATTSGISSPPRSRPCAAVPKPASAARSSRAPAAAAPATGFARKRRRSHPLLGARRCGRRVVVRLVRLRQHLRLPRGRRLRLHRQHLHLELRRRLAQHRVDTGLSPLEGLGVEDDGQHVAVPRLLEVLAQLLTPRPSWRPRWGAA